MNRALQLLLVCCLLTAWACAGDGGDDKDQGDATNNATNNAGGDGANNTNNDATNNTNNDAPNNASNDADRGPYGGTYLVGLAVAPLSGLVLPFQVDIESQQEDEAITFEAMTLRATNEDGEVSQVLSTARDVAVQDGSFEVDFGVFTMPGAFTPTGSDVDVEVRFLGQIQEEGLLCGDVTGAIVTFGFDLEGSTFGAVTAGPEAQIQSSCQAGQGALLPRVQAEDCPALAPGTVEGFASAGRSRSFELIAPEGVDEDTALPLVFVFHGIGDSPGGILGRSELRQMAQEQGFMIAAPAGFEIDGTATWNVVSPENEDVAFFDDMLTCLGASFNVDQDRVYVAGHSNGGLFASNLLRLRSERLAAAAPISGGWFTELDSAQRPLPVMVTWGGSADMAFNQDFHQRSLDLIEGLRADGHFVVACDHGQGHLFPEETWGWLVQFLLAHDLQSVDSPLAQGLPEGFPSYCEVSP